MANDNHYSSKLPSALVGNYEWQFDGECNKYDPEMFYLPYNLRMSQKREFIARAKEVCAVCPVAQKCREFALETEQEFGIWGGMSEEERRKVLVRKPKNKS